MMENVCRSFTWTIDKTNHKEVYKCLHNSNLLLVSDGGHKHSGTYAWIISTQNEVIIARGDGIVDGSLSLMSSFRAEATGLLHGLIALSQIIYHLDQINPYFNDKPLVVNHKIQQRVLIHSDSLSLVQRLRDWQHYQHYYPSVGTKCDADLCLEIMGIVSYEFSPQCISFHHVRGHQDSKKTFDQLTWQEILNCDCDHRASATLASLSHADRPNIATSYYSNIDLLSKGIPITNKIAATIRQKYGSTEMRTYLCNKFDWVSSTCDTIDWLCHGRALSRLPNTNQVFVVK